MSGAVSSGTTGRWVDAAARAGLIAYGLVHLVIGWLALQLALGEDQGSASSSGAVQELAQQPFGRVLVWAVAIGMALLVIWRLVEAVAGDADTDDEPASGVRTRLISVGKAVVYAVIGVSAIQVATGGASSGGSSEKKTDSRTADLMGLPGGQVLVALVGLAIIGYGLSHLVRAWTEKFAENLTSEGKAGSDGTAYVWFGKIGYAAKGVAIATVGCLFAYAAITRDAKESGGLDQALREVLGAPAGPALLVVTALGIGCYGLFCFARARHLSR